MASESARDGSVYDFLYADTRRLSSFLSQFSDDGIVTELARITEETSSVKAAVSVKVVAGDSTQSGRESKTLKIDPQWLLPLLFLDQAADLIERDIAEAPIGSLVLIQGRMVVTDVRILQNMWAVPSSKKFLVASLAGQQTPETDPTDAGNRASRRAAGKALPKKDPELPIEVEMAFELLPHLPHSPHISILGLEHTAWATVDPAYVVGTVEDLTLKHGAKIAGSWAMVGVLDARPFEASDDVDHDYDEILSFDEQVRLGMISDNIWKVATELQQGVRSMLGRPLLSYGVTPIVIFREIERPEGQSGAS